MQQEKRTPIQKANDILVGVYHGIVWFSVEEEEAITNVLIKLYEEQEKERVEKGLHQV
jgi:hypothetical protein